ncbi:unnamed protein product [Knipowitschia caucasica]
MAVGKMRSTRKLRDWMVTQVNSGRYPGVVWDDENRTRFRIPWKHAGKQDFRKDEDAAIFKAWAEFKGKLTAKEQNNPASWKTRLRCALNKSPEFREENGRAQLDISEPYKVYSLVPPSEQGFPSPQKKSCERRKRKSSEKNQKPEPKTIKTEEEPETTLENVEVFFGSEIVHVEETATNQLPRPTEEMDEITLDVRIEETAQTEPDSFRVVVQYWGQEVARQQVFSSDVRIQYLCSPLCPPSALPQGAQFPSVVLPPPPCSLGQGQELAALTTLLPFMEKGVVLTSTPRGVYGRRFCQGRVFWAGPHCGRGLHKLERHTEPELLFCKDAFKQQLDLFCSSRGERPSCGFTLCFGEELNETEETSRKLIIVQVSLPWAEKQVEDFESIVRSINLFQSLADQNPTGEITIHLEPVPEGEI